MAWSSRPCAACGQGDGCVCGEKLHRILILAILRSNLSRRSNHAGKNKDNSTAYLCFAVVWIPLDEAQWSVSRIVYHSCRVASNYFQVFILGVNFPEHRFVWVRSSSVPS
jgi:hypothetical protein